MIEYLIIGSWLYGSVLAQQVHVLCFVGEWKDFDAWNILTEAMNDKVVGNTIDVGCENKVIEHT